MGTAERLVLGAATPAACCRRQGRDLPSFPEQPETRLLKQNCLISKFWESAHLFKNTEWTKETPPAPWAARGHLCSLGWGVRSSRHAGLLSIRSVSGRQWGGCTLHSAAHWAAGSCPAPTLRHSCGLNSPFPQLKTRLLDQRQLLRFL